jgi:hypothetical protein
MYSVGLCNNLQDSFCIQISGEKLYLMNTAVVLQWELYAGCLCFVSE